MKRIVLALLVGSALITSCGSNKSFNKKRHSHRNWVKVGEHTDSEFAQAETVKTEKEVAQTTANVVEKTQVEENNVAVIETTDAAEVKVETKAAVEDKVETPEKAMVIETTNDVQELSAPTEAKESKAPVVKKKRKKRGGIMGMLEVSTLILIIIAIFIPPLAVFLYEGVTNRFWLNLILWLVAIGVGFALFGAGLAFLAGLIAFVHAVLIITGNI